MPTLIKPTPLQQKFIDNWDKSILLQACVGTGKTFSLALRVAMAINKGVPPEKILCVTFTNRAADEMRERIKKYCQGYAHRVVIKTFHGFCARVLYQSAKRLGIPQDFSIFDDDDTIELITELNLTKILNLEEKQISSLIQTYKIEGVLPKHINPQLFINAFTMYQNKLSANCALDFSDLISLVNKAFNENHLVQEEWSKRFDLIQVDEMQDTHIAEYNIIAFLAKHGNNLVLTGDFDQTIYEWRGSEPEKVIRCFSQDFPQHLTINFDENHRSTKTLVKAACSVVSTYNKNPLPRPAANMEIGSPIVIEGLLDEYSEAEWVANEVKNLHKSGIPYSKIGVLTRSNNRATVVSQAMQLMEIPHITADTYQFFQRQEVKNCLAYLRFLLNPEDQASFRRMLKNYSINETVIDNIIAAESTGLRLSDFGSWSTLYFSDPFTPLLQALESGSIIIFDCETTGIDPKVDEIVQIAAYKIQNGRLLEEFHRLIKPTKSVGDSFYIHGFSDDYLNKRGEDGKTVLLEFKNFAANSVIVGHNVRFDLDMVQAVLQRYGLSFEQQYFYDTLIIAKRFLDEPSYRLGDLAKSLNLPHKPTHQADEDVAATWDLLRYLAPLIKKDASQRRQLVQSIAYLFWPLAAKIGKWKDLVKVNRPPEVLKIVLQESGLFDQYKDKPLKMVSFRELLNTCKIRDDHNLHPGLALDTFLKFASLAKNIDRIDTEERVAVITVHQAKGLEFDVVFMPGLIENEFPNWFALNENKEIEERRVFYVGITRAKKQLLLSYHLYSGDRYRKPSRYLRLIPQTTEQKIRTGSVL